MKYANLSDLHTIRPDKLIQEQVEDRIRVILIKKVRIQELTLSVVVLLIFMSRRKLSGLMNM